MKVVKAGGMSAVGAIGAPIAGAGMGAIETLLPRRGGRKAPTKKYQEQQRAAEQASTGGFPLRQTRGLSGVVSGPSGVLYHRAGSGQLTRVFPKTKGGKKARLRERARLRDVAAANAKAAEKAPVEGANG